MHIYLFKEGKNPYNKEIKMRGNVTISKSIGGDLTSVLNSMWTYMHMWLSFMNKSNIIRTRHIGQPDLGKRACPQGRQQEGR